MGKGQERSAGRPARGEDGRLRGTGLFLAGVCLFMFVFDFVYMVASGHFTPTNIMYNVILAVSVAVFALSALKPRLAWIQPLALLLTSALPTYEDPVGGYGICFFLMGVVLLVRLGFFGRFRIAKALGLVVYYTAVVVASYLPKPGSTASDFAAPSLFLIAVSAFFLLAFQGRIAVYLKEPKERLSLSEKGLTPAERTYTLSLLTGRSIKEIAFDFEVSDSTVRNTLARAYKKLEVEDKSALALLAEKREIVD